jgi:hypothetical protein
MGSVVQTTDICFCIYESDENPIDLMNKVIFENLIEGGSSKKIIVLPVSMKKIAEHHQQKEKNHERT